jgi:ubiquinone/menaquinone biosynthesis C-methylase UbiE
MAADYALHRQVHPGVFSRLLAGGQVAEPSNVLEVGSGTGNYIIALQTLTGCLGFGLEPSQEMLNAARRRRGNVKFVLGHAESLNFEPASFHLIFSVDVIHHVGDRSAYFRAALDALSPGGRICTVTDSAEDILRRSPLSSYFPETVDVELARYPRIDILQAELASTGFTEITTEQTEIAYDLTDLQPYRDRAFSSLHLIPQETFAQGIARMEADLSRGPIRALSLYTLLWGDSPQRGEVAQSAGGGLRPV